MRQYLYNYQTLVSFSEAIAGHQVMLRCQPSLSDFQHMEEEHLVLPPIFNMRKSTDVYGNRIIYGGTREEHQSLAYISCGIISCHRYAIRAEAMRPFYGLVTPLTQATDDILEIIPEAKGNIESRAMDISHIVNGMIEYCPYTTTNTTAASEVLRQKKGVCQDMAHLMIAMCREQGLTARYANGFIDGEGQTHAWVEVWDNGTWIGIDPTHDRLIDYGYIKIAHGRDAQDCPVNRGTYMGNVIQQTDISVTVKEI